MTRNCSVGNTKKNKNIYRKDKTVCKNCYNEKKRKNKSTNSYQQPKIERGINNDNRTLMVGPIFPVKLI